MTSAGVDARPVARRLPKAADPATFALVQSALHQVLPPPPSLPGVPLIGHLREFMRDPVALFVRGYRELGPIYSIRALHRGYVVMAGPEAMRFLAKHEREHFSMGPVYGDMVRLFHAKNSVISADGEQHAAMRKLFRPSMARSALEGRLDEFVEATRGRLRHFEGQELDLLRVSRDLVFHQLATVMEMGGVDPSAYYEDIVRAFHTSLEVGVTRRWPRFVTWLPSYRRSRDRSLAFGQKLVDTLSGEGRGEGLYPAIATALEKGLIESCDVPFLALIPLIAGLDTVASSTAFMLAAVFRDPALVQTLRGEVDAVADGPFLRADLPRVAATTKEVVRRYPVTTVSIRHCTVPFEFEGHRVEAGTDVMFAISAQLFMEEFFSDPLRFDPERFLGEGAALARGNAFTPFGVGAHACLGTGLAEAQLEATLATVLHECDVQLPRGNRPIDMQHDPFPIPAGETVRFTRRRR